MPSKADTRANYIGPALPAADFRTGACSPDSFVGISSSELETGYLY